MHHQIAPHGGELVNRIVNGEKRNFLIEKSEEMPVITVDGPTLSDIEMIGTGAMSPLEGFMCRSDYNHVVDHMRLASGVPWSLPIVLGVSHDEADACDVGAHVALKDEKGTLIAVLTLQERYIVDKEREAGMVYRTTETAHPGVKYITEKRGDVLLGGDIDVITLPPHDDFSEYRLTPVETRHAFEQNGWHRIVAFQTRNPIHRAHEYLQKCALEICDGLLIHPLVGATKKDDIPAETRMNCYTTLIENYYPEDRVMLSVFPAAMRYAGPREAVFHAIVRKNYGCTHFIVGRDHAGVGNYYGTYDAQEIFKEFGAHELDIVPLFFEHAAYCKKCKGMVSQKTCPHSSDNHIFLSGTKVREMLIKGERPPEEFTRPEVADILIEAARKSA
jgi:sulfate adenylyltransferase